MNNNEPIREKRATLPLSRKEIEERLTMEQMVSLRRLESFGWTLRFVREPLFQDPVAVVVQGRGRAIGILEQDGKLNVDVDIQIRDES